MQLIESSQNNNQAIIYEVNLTIANEVIEDFDAWLQKHVDEMLAIPGFISASTSVIENNDEETKQRCVQYRLVNKQALDLYFENDAERMRAEGLEKFSGKMSAQRRILTPSQAALAEETACANCGTQLEGRFCSSCGQREEPRVPTFMSMLREVTNAMFGLESRLWRTIAVLFVFPGYLTHTYLSGKRQKYTTPFRVFLLFSIISVAYVTFLSTQSLASFSASQVESFAKGFEDGFESNESDEFGTKKPSTQKNDSVGKNNVNTNISVSSGLLSDEIENRIRRQIQKSVRQLFADMKNGRTDRVVENLIQPLPKVLLLFLPFIALAFKIIYLGRGKYYVEHLIYLLHNHAFLFALLILTIISVQLAGFYPYLKYPIAILINLVFIYYAADFFIKKIQKHFPERKFRSLIHLLLLVVIVYGIYLFTKEEGIGSSMTLLWAFYVPYYMYRSMRVVYQSSRFVTLLSYGLVGLVYLVLFTVMLSMYIIFSGFTYG